MRVFTALTFTINGENSDFHRHNVERLMGAYPAFGATNWMVGPYRWSSVSENNNGYCSMAIENGVVTVYIDLKDTEEYPAEDYLCAFAEDARYCGFDVRIIEGPKDPSYKGLQTSRDRLTDVTLHRAAIAFFAMVDGLMVRKGMQVSL